MPRKIKTINKNREKITKEMKDKMMNRVGEGMSVYYKIPEIDYYDDEDGDEITVIDWANYDVGKWYIWRIKGYGLYELDGSKIDITEVIFDENDPKVIEYKKEHPGKSPSEEYVERYKNGGIGMW